jgi:hypothetical protein
MRIVTLYPDVRWDIVWTKLHEAWISNTMKTTWYQVIYDIVPTNEKLASMRLCDAAQSLLWEDRHSVTLPDRVYRSC